MELAHNLNIWRLYEGINMPYIKLVRLNGYENFLFHKGTFLNLYVSFMMPNKVYMRAGQTSCLKIYNAWQVAPFTNHHFPPFTALLHLHYPDWNESITAI